MLRLRRYLRIYNIFISKIQPRTFKHVIIIKFQHLDFLQTVNYANVEFSLEIKLIGLYKILCNQKIYSF